jgi:hypothetical protein
MSTLRRTLARIAAATALVGAAAALPAAPASASSTCTTDCLTAVSVTADTQKVRVNATTFGSTHTVAEVWKADRSVRLSTMSVTAAGYWATSFSFASTAYLPQNTYYAVKVVATDMLGATRTEWLSVRVKQRIATYYITRIDVADDSDAAGAGEFRAAWKAGTTVKPALWSGFSSKSSGGYWTFASTNANAVITRTGESAAPKVFLELSDDDRDPGDPCGTGVWTPTWGKGSNTCADWATAGATLALPETSTTKNFTLNVAKNSPVMFTVTGRVVTTVS